MKTTQESEECGRDPAAAELVELRRMIRALVASEPPIVEGYDTCIFCDAKLGSGWDDKERDADHGDECPYRMAKEWEAKREGDKPTACARCKCAGTVMASRAAGWKCQTEGCGGQMVRTNA